MSVKGLRIPTYDATKDGNVFHWIIEAAQDYRNIRQRQRDLDLEKMQFIQREKDKHDNVRPKPVQPRPK